MVCVCGVSGVSLRAVALGLVCMSSRNGSARCLKKKYENVEPRFEYDFQNANTECVFITMGKTNRTSCLLRVWNVLEEPI